MTSLLLALLACTPELPVGSEGTTDCSWFLDGDGDGFGDPGTEYLASCDDDLPSYVMDATDCDDEDAAVHPDGDEVCNDVDDDCDGLIDEDAGELWYGDTDGDGYGAGEAVVFCEDPGEGWSDNDLDCDDTDDETWPGAPLSVCDEADRDCDGSPDNADQDGDGYGACEECDDTDSSISPDGVEICDEIDQDCDGEIDEDPSDGSTWYLDADGDGFGDATSTVEACTQPEGYVADLSDCDDKRADVNPGVDELCNGLDDDCDGEIDEADATDASSWYVDSDADGYGTSDSVVQSCTRPEGYAATDDDCDDDDSAYNPGATEDDCTDPADYNCDGSTGYVDGDGDGYAACEECDDTDASINPDAEEECDTVDNDCDGTVDEDDAIDASTWYADTDSDGYGDASSTTQACSQPTGYTSDDSDCDDSDSSVSPSATEFCDDVDNDCDGTTDEDDASDATTWYVDGDGDGYGDSSTTYEACEVPSGYADNTDDCDDSDADVSPAADEYCDSVDNDCDGTVDEDDALDVSTWYADSDADTYGDPSTSTIDCDQPGGYVADDSDCDDSTADVSPVADETCDEVDNDCDGSVDEDDAIDASTWYADSDGDSYGTGGSTTEACDQPSGYVSDATDCDDADSGVNPGAAEVCDSVDNDCDGTVDEDDASDASTWYLDSDGDSYGDSGSTTASCSKPSGYSASSTDCDDSDGDVHPGASEECDGIDNDCDGTVDEDDAIDASTWYADSDGDSYGSATSTTTACDEPSGYTSDKSDCDDTDGSVNPGAKEYCDSVDNDCDGTVDEDDAVDASTWYLDSDSDSYGVSTSTTEACSLPSGYSSVSTDCDDTDSAVNPGAAEACNGTDDDCDGSTDEDFADVDSDGTADCVDDCPVYADPSLSTNGDGSSSSPYMSINDAITLRGGYCDEIVLKAGTYTEQVDYAGEDLDISSESGAATTIIDGSSASGSVITFDNGETSAAVLEGVTITGGDGTVGDDSSVGLSRTMSSGDRHGGGIFIKQSDPTIIDCIIEDNEVDGYGGGVWAKAYDGEFSGNTVQGNVSNADSINGSAMFLYNSDATLEGNEFLDNDCSSDSSAESAVMVSYGDPVIVGNWFEGNTSGSSGVGDAARWFEGGGLFANNVVTGHAGYALGVMDDSDVDIVNNTVVDNGSALYLSYNSTGYPDGDVVNNLFTHNDYYGIVANYYSCAALNSLSYNDLYDNGSDDWYSYYCEYYWGSSYGNESTDPKYEDRAGQDYNLKGKSGIKDSGTTGTGYGFTDDYSGTSRGSSSWSMGAYEK
jgi:hypothetical protein